MHCRFRGTHDVLVPITPYLADLFESLRSTGKRPARVRATDMRHVLLVLPFLLHDLLADEVAAFNLRYHNSPPVVDPSAELIDNNKIALMKIHQRQIICVEDWTRRPPRGPHPQGFTYTLSQTHTQSYTSLTRIHTHMTILTHFHSKPVQHHVRFLTCFSIPPC